MATPQVKRIQLYPNYDFILLGCDGIFEAQPNSRVVRGIWELQGTLLKNPLIPIHSRAGLSVLGCVRQSLDSKSMDNLTAVMICFESFKTAFQPLFPASSPPKNAIKFLDDRAECMICQLFFREVTVCGGYKWFTLGCESVN